MKQPADTIDLWFADPQQIRDRSLLEYYTSLLSDEERAKQNRFRFAHHRHVYLITRALEKIVLSRYSGIPVADLRFDCNANGKPALRLPPASEALHYNLSHTDTLIMLGCCRSYALGVDVESMPRHVEMDGIASLCFTAAEIASIQQQPTADEQKRRFFEFWTLKEALIKGIGKGMSIPLHSIEFDISRQGTIRYRDENQGLHGQWQCFSFAVDENHLAAVCVQAGGTMNFRLNLRRIVPAVSEQTLRLCSNVASSTPCDGHP